MKNAFVIMPFSSTSTCTEDEWTEIFENIFKPAIEECGYICQRSMPMTGSLPQSIIEQLRYSQIVLADITDRNPNVFYELGIRHCLRRGTIMVSQGEQHLPSDLRGYWFINYGIRPKEVAQFKSEIRRLVTLIEKHPQKNDNPVADYLEKEQYTILSFTQTENIKKLGALYTELSGNLLGLVDIRRNLDSDAFLSYDCLSLLIATRYVDIGPDLFKTAYELQYKLLRIERGERRIRFLVSAINECTTFGKAILDIKNKIALDQYDEPNVVTTMIWKPPTVPLTTEDAMEEMLIRDCYGVLHDGIYSDSDGTALLNPDEVNETD